jgi:hypothetical protein
MARTPKKKPAKTPTTEPAKRKKLKLSKDTLRDLAAPDSTARKVRGGWVMATDPRRGC